MPRFRVVSGYTHYEPDEFFVEAAGPEELSRWATRHTRELLERTIRERKGWLPSLFLLVAVASSECFRSCDSYLFDTEDKIHPLRRPLLNKTGRFLDVEFRMIPNRVAIGEPLERGVRHLEYIVYRCADSASPAA